MEAAGRANRCWRISINHFSASGSIMWISFIRERPDPETPLEETLATFDEIVRSGKALYLGLSNYSGQALAEALSQSRQPNRSPIVAQQVVYNLVQRESEHELCDDP